MIPRILVVDDEPNVRLHYRAALETESYDVVAGVLFELLGDFDRAQRRYSRAIAQNNDHEPALQNRRRLKELARSGASNEPIDLGHG